MLTVVTPLTVQGLSISSDRTVVYITTNYVNADFSVATVVIDFPATALVSSDGLLYQSTTGTFALSNPVFQQSLFEIFYKNVSYGA